MAQKEIKNTVIAYIPGKGLSEIDKEEAEKLLGPVIEKITTRQKIRKEIAMQRKEKHKRYKQRKLDRIRKEKLST